MKPIDFWYSIGSTYTYLTVMRLAEYAETRQLRINWRPFDVRAIMIEQMNIPFRDKPVKANYMWRDIERRAASYGLPISVPAPYPLEELAFVNQVALLGHREGWGEEFTAETYRQWFVDGLPGGVEPNLSEALRRAGQEPSRIIETARSKELAVALVEETRTARDLGVFGSPSFVVEGEVFWGDDRLDDAASWYRDGKVV